MYKRQELAAILDKVQLNEKVAVCLDTCHVWDGGYDIVRDLEMCIRDRQKTLCGI